MSAVLATATTTDPQFTHLPRTLLRPSPTNPRHTKRKQTLEELAESFKEHGIISPIIVRPVPEPQDGQPTHEIVAGERRWLAAEIAGLDFVPVLVRELTDFQVLEIQIIENDQREEVHPLEAAEGYQKLLRKPDELQGYTLEELAARLGKSVSFVRARLNLCHLCTEARQAVYADKIGIAIAQLIARMPAGLQPAATKDVVQGYGGTPMSFREAQAHIEKAYMLQLAHAPFSVTSTELLPQCGSCTACPKRTGASPGLFEDVKSEDVCTDPPCFAAKKAAHFEQLVAKAKAEGREVITGAAARVVKPAESSELKGYLPLDKPHPKATSSQPLRSLLRDGGPPVALLEDPKTHDLIEVVREDAATLALKNKKLLQREPKPPKQPKKKEQTHEAAADAAAASEARGKADRAAERLVEIEREWRNRAADALWARLNDGTDQGMPDSVLRILLVDVLLNTDVSVERIRAIGQIELSEAMVMRDQLRADEVVVTMTDNQVRNLLTYVTALIDLNARENDHPNKGDPLYIESIASELDLDLAPIKKQAISTVDTARHEAAQAARTPEQALAKAVEQPKAPVRYRDPMTGQAWSGRGLQPKWLKVALADGRKLSEFEVTSATPAAKMPEPVVAWPFPTKGARP
jgi:ParB/RepB/Spo0J family partition protein